MIANQLDRTEFENMVKYMQALGDEPLVWRIASDSLTEVDQAFDRPAPSSDTLGIPVEVPAGDGYFSADYLKTHWPIELLGVRDTVIGYHRQLLNDYGCAVVIIPPQKD